MDIETRKSIAKQLNDKLVYLRDSARRGNPDWLYRKLVNINSYRGCKVSYTDWIDVMTDNDYFNIQNSRSFCDKVKSQVARGASPKYLVYCRYVRQLRTQFFAPAYEHGLRGALLMTVQSILVYLNRPRGTWLKYKAKCQKRLQTLKRAYRAKRVA